MSDPCILIVESDGLIRAPLSQYLRECGYKVLEAVNVDEARQVLMSGEWRIDVVLAGVQSPGAGGFSLAAWVRRSYPTVAVILAGSVAAATEKAGDLCDEGPKLSKPYDHRVVLDRIRRLLAARDRRRATGPK